ETIIERCTHAVVGSQGEKVPVNSKLSQMLLGEVVAYGNRGLRVIALASVDDIGSHPLLDSATSTDHYAQIEQNLTFIGLVAMADPPRPEVPASVRKCKDAGI